MLRKYSLLELSTTKPWPTPPFFPLYSLARPDTQASKMAAAIKALNAKIRSNKVTDYFFSTRLFHLPNARPSQLITICRFLGPRVQLRHPYCRCDGHSERRCDHFRPYDHCLDILLGDVHAVRASGAAKELFAVCVPLCELRVASNTRL